MRGRIVASFLHETRPQLCHLRISGPHPVTTDRQNKQFYFLDGLAASSSTAIHSRMAGRRTLLEVLHSWRARQNERSDGTLADLPSIKIDAPNGGSWSRISSGSDHEKYLGNQDIEKKLAELPRGTRSFSARSICPGRRRFWYYRVDGTSATAGSRRRPMKLGWLVSQLVDPHVVSTSPVDGYF
jgi:hypothetical protein